MKFLLVLVLAVVVVVFLTIVNADDETTMPTESTWARTYPIRYPKTEKTRPPPVPIPRRTTTNVVRVSNGVLIGVPVALFVVTLGVGFVALVLVVRSLVGNRHMRVEHLNP